MKDKVLTYAIGISIAAHLVAVGIVGRTSASRLSTAPVAPVPRMVKVDLIRDPYSTPKPEVTAAPRPVHTAPRTAGPVVGSIAAPRPVSAVVRNVDRRHVSPPGTGGAKDAGNPGGELNVGTRSTGGDIGGSFGSGNTPPGWVPGNRGPGRGAGTGQGVGTPDPPRNADPGPGTRPTPEPTPVPVPAPRMVSAKICEASGVLAGEHCKRTGARSFVEGKEPTRTCSRCRAPEPEFQSKIADRANPELVRDSRVNTASLEEGLSCEVQVEYTVTADGDVTGARAVKSSGNRAADRACVNATEKLKYKPAVQNGIARSVRMTRTYKIRT